MGFWHIYMGINGAGGTVTAVQVGGRDLFIDDTLFV